MNDREYSAMQGIRRSDLYWIKKSPMHFKYHIEHPEESAALLFGSAAHKMILEPESFSEEYAVLPNVDRRTKAGKAEIEAFKAEHATQSWITEDDYQTIIQMHEALMMNPEVADILNRQNRIEVPFTWIDSETGEICKCKADILTELDEMPYIIDYKTTQSCSDGAFESSCRKYGYKFQAGFYAEGIDLCTLESHGFAFIAQEKTPPYASRLYRCDDVFISEGKAEFHQLLRRFHRCKELDEWKGYESEYLYGDEYE